MQDYQPAGRHRRRADTSGDQFSPTCNQARFPFYGQPLDLKITIAGAVSEARPADISAQAAWMQKWGWIPQYHGSGFMNVSGTAAATRHAGEGGPSARQRQHPGHRPDLRVRPAGRLPGR